MKMRTSVRLASLPLLACLAYLPAAQAATIDTTFQVTANVAVTCSALTAGDMVFGTYSGTTIDRTSTISVTCTNSGDFTVGLDDGLHPEAPGGQRRMQKTSGEYLSYELYSDAGRTSRWGNASPTWVSAVGTGEPQTLTVYGRIPAGTVPSGGYYTDTITVTVTYAP